MGSATPPSSNVHPLLALRRSLGLSREVLGAKAGISPRTIYNIEVEGVRPQRSTVRVLCLALDCDPGSLGWDEKAAA